MKLLVKATDNDGSEYKDVLKKYKLQTYKKKYELFNEEKIYNLHVIDISTPQQLYELSSEIEVELIVRERIYKFEVPVSTEGIEFDGLLEIYDSYRE